MGGRTAFGNSDQPQQGPYLLSLNALKVKLVATECGMYS